MVQSGKNWRADDHSAPLDSSLTVRYLGIEVDDALTIAEQVEV